MTAVRRVNAASDAKAPRILDAVAGIAHDLSLSDILRRMVESACELTGAPFGALSVLDSDEFIRFGDAWERPPSGDDARVVPIRMRGRIFGMLYLAPKPDGEEFTESENDLLVALTAAAGVVIENAALFDQVQRRERWLEASYHVTGALLTDQDLTATLRLIAERARVVAGGTAGAVARPRGDGHLVFEIVEPPGPDSDRLAGIAVPAEGTATGLAFTTGKPVVVRDYGEKVVEYQGGRGAVMPAAIKDLDSTVAVPLIVGEEKLGVLLVAKFRDRTPFSAYDVQLAETFAAHAALAVEFARAQQDRQRLAVFEDRDRIARDLHDLVIQRLFAIGLGLEGLSRLASEPAVADRVTGFAHEIDRTIREIRNSIFSLQEPAEAQGSLRSELLRVALDAGCASEPRVGFDGPLDSTVPDTVRTDLIATLREALSNVVRHAAATTVSVDVAVDRDGRWLELSVVDDGVGMPAEPGHRSGVTNLAERAARWNGTFRVAARPEGGTRLDWSVELPARQGSVG
ncbi:GAF domain-containing protein [Amycolatopsis sp. EV170708-02-1]|uniref:sensor histidine kinase n=1 Tax=Amycolatopsis sp. EV170708-02-1 TaxID=2919322 RepID=UPI001F0CD3DC|nr:GAF domain-containing protein [Amycolatopsis sp. EV170708-02-1]UMP06486.1 GAF domain-containing protein [Amycolatopsis sp. EV170708-02-1]